MENDKNRKLKPFSKFADSEMLSDFIEQGEKPDGINL